MTFHEFNTISRPELVTVLTKCCGSSAWVNKMLEFIPAEDMVEVFEDAEETWWSLSQEDWKEAFAHHPRIGDLEAIGRNFEATAALASGEQKEVSKAPKEILLALVEANKTYETKFGYIFIVCATGKSAEEMLGLLEDRLKNDAETEIEIAAEEQFKITRLRLEQLID